MAKNAAGVTKEVLKSGIFRFLFQEESVEKAILRWRDLVGGAGSPTVPSMDWDDILALEKWARSQKAGTQNRLRVLRSTGEDPWIELVVAGPEDGPDWHFRVLVCWGMTDGVEISWNGAAGNENELRKFLNGLKEVRETPEHLEAENPEPFNWDRHPYNDQREFGDDD